MAGYPTFHGVGLGGGGTTVTPEATTQTWPGAFTTTDPGGVASWVWTAPDGTDQSASLTGGDGDTNDYMVCGLHVIKGLDGAGNVLAVHEVMVGDPAGFVPGAVKLPDFTTGTLTALSGIVKSITATGYTIDKTAPGSGNLPANYDYITWPFVIPAGKRVEVWYRDTNKAGWTANSSLVMNGIILSSNVAIPATATVHVGAGDYRWGGAAYRVSRVSLNTFAAVNPTGAVNISHGILLSSGDGSAWDLVVRGELDNGSNLGPNAEVSVTLDLDNVARAGIFCGRQTTSGSDEVVTGLEAYIMVY